MTTVNVINEASGSFTVSSGNLVVSTGNLTVSSGSIAAQTTLTAATNLIANGNLLLPTASATAGQIQINTVPWLNGMGTGNLFLGGAGNTLYATAYVTNNVGIGYGSCIQFDQVGHNNATRHNTAIGYGAIKYFYAAADNQNVSQVAMGYQALGANLGTGNISSVNIGIGSGAVSYGGTAAGYCIGIGTNACNYLQQYNIAIGYNAMPGAGSHNQSRNVALGAYANYSISTNATQGTVIGYNAAKLCGSAGYGAVVIGSQACAQQASGSLNYSVFIGYKAGYSINGSDSTYNLSIGYNTGSGVSSESSVTRIGGGTGTGTGQQNVIIISGIYGKTIGATAGVVIVDSTDQTGYLSAASGKLLMGGAKPVFSTAAYPLTTAQGDLLSSTSANTVVVLTKSTTATNYLSNTGTSNNAAWAQVNLANGVANVLPSSNGGIMASSEVTGTSQAIASGAAYIANNVSLVTFTLPASAAQGKRFEVIGDGSGKWAIAQNTGQTIHYGGSSTTTSSGTVLASDQWDSVTLICTTTNTDWVITRVSGAITLS